ncbi:ABC transporter substrate-binding protein [Paenibacillus oralis]|uniref:ABC transporter substrate-binding protein n=1 Tax=Paenibacillus oralis TaxID=2490856 RepID=A0A3P3U4A0_9BACL|nr:ABC transporter substrate-binding protein [Paenibacillus oralis]RRJ64964.1 ABC transporter substrate-binding protein [Paenibacillus oralis]
MSKFLVHAKSGFMARMSALLCCVLLGSVLTACSMKEGEAEPIGQPSSANVAEGSAAADENSAKSSGERTITDELGHEITIPAEPKNIFAPNLEDSLLRLGVKPVAQWSNGKRGHDYLQEELKGVPKLDFSEGQPSPEALLSYNPDLIILHTQTYAQNGNYEIYSKIAPTYVFTNASGNIENSLTTIGELLGKTDEANKALQAYRQKVKEAQEKLKEAVGEKKVAIIRFAHKGVSLMGGQYLCGYVVHRDLGLGISDLVGNENSASISMEILPELDADYIFVINAYGQGTERMKEMMESPIWKSMTAVKQGHVYEVSNEYWLGSGLIAYEKIVDDTVRLLTQ